MKSIRTFTVILLITVGISALTAGYFFITDPSGNTLDLSVALLKHSPFNSYLIPGILLFVFIGILNMIVAFLTTIKSSGHPRFIVIQSVILLGWIIIEMLLIREISFLHFFIAGIGILLFMMGNRLNV